MRVMRKSVCAALCLLVCGAATVAFWGPWGSSRRPLTAEEMAHVYGRQGQPDCNGCYLQVNGAGCNPVDDCGCSEVPQGEINGTCAAASQKASGRVTVNKSRPWDGKEKTNTDYVQTDPVLCYTLYTCIRDDVFANTACDGGTCSGVAVPDCQQCVRDAFIMFVTLQEDSCKTCPK